MTRHQLLTVAAALVVYVTTYLVADLVLGWPALAAFLLAYTLGFLTGSVPNLRAWLRRGRLLPDLPLMPRVLARSGRRRVLMTGHVRAARRWGFARPPRRGGVMHGVILGGRLFWIAVTLVHLRRVDLGGQRLPAPSPRR